MTESKPVSQCGLCNVSIEMTGTNRCDRCWELEKRIKSDVEITRVILQNIDKESKP